MNCVDSSLRKGEVLPKANVVHSLDSGSRRRVYMVCRAVGFQSIVPSRVLSSANEAALLPKLCPEHGANCSCWSVDSGPVDSLKFSRRGHSV